MGKKSRKGLSRAGQKCHPKAGMGHHKLHHSHSHEVHTDDEVEDGPAQVPPTTAASRSIEAPKLTPPEVEAVVTLHSESSENVGLVPSSLGATKDDPKAALSIGGKLDEYKRQTDLKRQRLRRLKEVSSVNDTSNSEEEPHQQPSLVETSVELSREYGDASVASEPVPRAQAVPVVLPKSAKTVADEGDGRDNLMDQQPFSNADSDPAQEIVASANCVTAESDDSPRTTFSEMVRFIADKKLDSDIDTIESVQSEPHLTVDIEPQEVFRDVAVSLPSAGTPALNENEDIPRTVSSLSSGGKDNDGGNLSAPQIKPEKDGKNSRGGGGGWLAFMADKVQDEMPLEDGSADGGWPVVVADSADVPFDDDESDFGLDELLGDGPTATGLVQSNTGPNDFAAAKEITTGLTNKSVEATPAASTMARELAASVALDQAADRNADVVVEESADEGKELPDKDFEATPVGAGLETALRNNSMEENIRKYDHVVDEEESVTEVPIVVTVKTRRKATKTVVLEKASAADKKEAPSAEPVASPVERTEAGGVSRGVVDEPRSKVDDTALKEVQPNVVTRQLGVIQSIQAPKTDVLSKGFVQVHERGDQREERAPSLVGEPEPGLELYDNVVGAEQDEAGVASHPPTEPSHQLSESRDLPVVDLVSHRAVVETEARISEPTTAARPIENDVDQEMSNGMGSEDVRRASHAGSPAAGTPNGRSENGSRDAALQIRIERLTIEKNSLISDMKKLKDARKTLIARLVDVEHRATQLQHETARLKDVKEITYAEMKNLLILQHRETLLLQERVFVLERKRSQSSFLLKVVFVLALLTAMIVLMRAWVVPPGPPHEVYFDSLDEPELTGFDLMKRRIGTNVEHGFFME